LDFNPALPFTSFEPPPRRRERRRATELFFLRQGEARFVVKSFAEPADGSEDAARRVRRELAGIAAFRAAGAAALTPLFGPADPLALEVDGRRVELRHSLVFPFVESPTVYDAIAAAPDPTPMIREAGRRIRARHDAATTMDAIHSDGSAHNVFADWTWFDFCEPHSGDQLREAKALELLRFVASVVEVSGGRTTRARVKAFCESYGDEHVLQLTLDYARTDDTHMRARMWARMLGRPDKLVSLWLGDGRPFRRIRTWDALERALR
jgi:hypothetical protein